MGEQAGDMKKLRRLRHLSGLTQYQLARQAGVNRSKISLVETGQAHLANDEGRRVVRVLSQSLERRAEVIGRALAGETADLAEGMALTKDELTPSIGAQEWRDTMARNSSVVDVRD